MSPEGFFFASGLRFQCLQCGGCCTGDPGTVYLGTQEAQHIANHLHTPLKRFLQRFAYPFRNAYSLKEDSQGSCIFYKSGCVIYPVRPLQCRAFPFWVRNLRNQDRWEEVAGECPGIGRGPLHSAEEILHWLQQSPI